MGDLNNQKAAAVMSGGIRLSKEEITDALQATTNEAHLAGHSTTALEGPDELRAFTMPISALVGNRWFAVGDLFSAIYGDSAPEGTWGNRHEQDISVCYSTKDKDRNGGIEYINMVKDYVDVNIFAESGWLALVPGMRSELADGPWFCAVIYLVG